MYRIRDVYQTTIQMRLLNIVLYLIIRSNAFAKTYLIILSNNNL